MPKARLLVVALTMSAVFGPMSGSLARSPEDALEFAAVDTAPQQWPAERTACPDARGPCTWERTFGGRLEDKAYAVAASPGGGVFVAGHSRSLGDARYDGWILCLDRGGNVVWQQSIGGRLSDQLYGIAPARDGGAVVAGHTRSRGRGGSDAWVVRMNASGSVIWDRVYGGEEDDRARAIAPTGDGGFLVVGHTRSSGAGQDDAWVLHLDAAGAILWERLYGGALWDWPAALAILSDGGIGLAGYTTTIGAGYEDFWLLRLDEAGRLHPSSD